MDRWFWICEARAKEPRVTQCSWGPGKWLYMESTSMVFRSLNGRRLTLRLCWPSLALKGLRLTSLEELLGSGAVKYHNSGSA